MNKNTLLNIASFICKLINFFLLFALIAITAVFMHLQIDREFYEGWKMEKPVKGKTIQIEKTLGELENDPNSVYVTNWKTASLYFNYLKFTGILLFIFLAVREFNSVMKSVKNLKTFRKNNVRAFRRIGFYCIVIAGFSWFNYWDFTNYHRAGFQIDTNYLLLALLAFIFAEIFKEGNQLMEENQLTI